MILKKQTKAASKGRESRREVKGEGFQVGEGD